MAGGRERKSWWEKEDSSMVVSLGVVLNLIGAPLSSLDGASNMSWTRDSEGVPLDEVDGLGERTVGVLARYRAPFRGRWAAFRGRAERGSISRCDKMELSNHTLPVDVRYIGMIMLSESTLR